MQTLYSLSKMWSINLQEVEMRKISHCLDLILILRLKFGDKTHKQVFSEQYFEVFFSPLSYVYKKNY